MCDSIYYSSLTQGDDVRWTLYGKSSNINLTSILNAMENNHLHSLLGKKCAIAKYLKSDLDYFRHWLDSTFYPAFFTIRDFQNSVELTSKLLEIKSRINRILNETKAHQSEIRLNPAKSNFVKKSKAYDEAEYILTQIKNEDKQVSICSQQNSDLLKVTSNVVLETNPSTNGETYKKLSKKNNETSSDETKNLEIIAHKELLQTMVIYNRSQDKVQRKYDDKVATYSSEQINNQEQTTSNEILKSKSSSSICTTSQSFDSSENLNDGSVKSCLNMDLMIKVLYPNSITTKMIQIQKNNLCTIQSVTDSKFHCLICCKDLYNEKHILNHLFTNLHQQSINDPICVKKVYDYHKLFAQLPSYMQFHQVLFSPDQNCVCCKLCKIFVSGNNIVSHINGMKHRVALPRAKKFHFYFEMLDSLKYQLENKSKNLIVPKVKSEISMNLLVPQAPKENTDPSQNDSNATKKPIPPKSHSIILAFKENPDPEDLFQSLENRYQVHKQFIVKSDNELLCNICKVVVKDDKEVLREHILLPKHLKLAKKVLGKVHWHYQCDLCSLKLGDNVGLWKKHFEQPGHLLRQSSTPNNNPGDLYSEYECSTCMIVIFGNEKSIAKHHLQSKRVKHKKELKLPPSIEKIFSRDKLLNEKISLLTNESEEVLDTANLNMECCLAFQDVMQKTYPSCRAYPFGSRVSGIGCTTSDLDVFLDTGMMYDGLNHQDAVSQAAIVKMASKILRAHPDFTDINPIPSARTPIIQVYHKGTKLDCDVSFRHGLSVENTEFLRLCFDIQPTLRTTILILKQWLQSCWFSSISTYAMAMMAIFYMQTKGYLPSIKKIRELDQTPCRIIGGWETFRFTKPIEIVMKEVKPYQGLPKDLLLEFFKYCVDFKFNAEVICPLLGHTVQKQDFSEKDYATKLPIEMKSYIEKIQQNEQSEKFRNLTPMCIQDPFDLSHNLTKACSVEVVVKFVKLCELSGNCLARI